MSRWPVVVASAALLAAALAAPASAEIRSGSVDGSTLKPANPDLRVRHTHISYDTQGILAGDVTTAGQLRDRNVFVVFVAGVYDRKRACRATDRDQLGLVGGAVDTFSVPPVQDPQSPLPPATRLARYGSETLGSDRIEYAATGPTARLLAREAAFAGHAWDCGWVEVSDGATLETADRSPVFPLGRRAVAENRRLRAAALARCARFSRASARKTCRLKARERYPA
jgi:hypothetical protein